MVRERQAKMHKYPVCPYSSMSDRVLTLCWNYAVDGWTTQVLERSALGYVTRTVWVDPAFIDYFIWLEAEAVT